MLSYTHVLAGLLLMLLVSAVALDLCSVDNTGSSSFSNDYMSNGLCSDRCRSQGFQVAITQNKLCYCSNSVPANTVSLGRCNTGCPGYSEQEKCGGEGLYGYIIVGNPSTLSNAALETLTKQESLSAFLTQTDSTSLSEVSEVNMSSSEASFSLASPSLSSLNPSLTLSTLPLTQKQSLTLSTLSPTRTLSLSRKKLSLSPSVTSSPTLESTHIIATTVVSIMTVNGSKTASVSTKYITELPKPTSLASGAPRVSKSLSFFNSKGKVAGTFTAVGLVVAAVICTLLYCCCCGAWSRRHEFDEEMQSTSDESLFTNEKTVVGAQLSPEIKRKSSSKSLLSIFNPAAGPPAGGAVSTVTRTHSKRKLNPRNEPAQGGPMMFSIMEFDNVMDPTLDAPSEHNKSKVSLNDDVDYSNAYQGRTLHIANPE